MCAHAPSHTQHAYQASSLPDSGLECELLRDAARGRVERVVVDLRVRTITITSTTNNTNCSDSHNEPATCRRIRSTTDLPPPRALLASSANGCDTVIVVHITPQIGSSTTHTHKASPASTALFLVALRRCTIFDTNSLMSARVAWCRYSTAACRARTYALNPCTDSCAHTPARGCRSCTPD
jgi:hypothetical protein